MTLLFLLNFIGKLAARFSSEPLLRSSHKTLEPLHQIALLSVSSLIFIHQPRVAFSCDNVAGNANVAGLSRDLKLSAAKYEYNIALMAFYIFYMYVFCEMRRKAPAM